METCVRRQKRRTFSVLMEVYLVVLSSRIVLTVASPLMALRHKAIRTLSNRLVSEVVRTLAVMPLIRGPSIFESIVARLTVYGMVAEYQKYPISKKPLRQARIRNLISGALERR